MGVALTKEGTNSGAETSSPLAASVRREMSRSVRLEGDEGERRAEKASAEASRDGRVDEAMYEGERVEDGCQEEGGERSGLQRVPIPSRDMAASRSVVVAGYGWGCIGRTVHETK